MKFLRPTPVAPPEFDIAVVTPAGTSRFTGVEWAVGEAGSLHIYRNEDEVFTYAPGYWLCVNGVDDGEVDL